MFRADLTGLLTEEGNRLLVEADNSAVPNSRWYSGAGIYRPVWQLTAGRTYIVPGSLRVTTESIDPAVVRVECEAAGGNASAAAIVKKDDAMVASVRLQKAPDSQRFTGAVMIPDPKLWSDESPELYEVTVTLVPEDFAAQAAKEETLTVLDEETVKFGIRTLSWGPKGFFVNGKETLLKGGCVHHDNGILGARSFAEAEWQRVAILKNYGFNAIRSAHNPMSRSALEACDALGVYVMDELWDMWFQKKNPHDYAEHFMAHFKEDIASMVDKDYNHPSVVMYSIGNEVSEPAKPEGLAVAKEIVTELKKLDSSRPTTGGINIMILLMSSMGIDLFASNMQEEEKDTGDIIEEAKQKMAEKKPETPVDSTAFNEMISQQGDQMSAASARPEADAVSSPLFELLDIAGYNYGISRYENEGTLHPERVVVGSETFPKDIYRVWQQIKKTPYLIGDFMWTSWDYLGEVGIGSWTYEESMDGFNKPFPWILAEAGALDILGNETAEAGLAAVAFGAKKSYLAARPANHGGREPFMAMWRGTNALPSWSYRNCEGTETVVEVYGEGAEAELLLNGASLGREKLIDGQAKFKVTYEPGELRSVVYDECGQPVAGDVLQSAEGGIFIAIDVIHPLTDSGVRYYMLNLRGRKNGVVECSADTRLTVEVENGELLALGSARPNEEESYLTNTVTTYYGRALAIVRAKEGFRMTVKGEGISNIAEVRLPD